jgi:tetratricopeptide (TPR) repeat protein
MLDRALVLAPNLAVAHDLRARLLHERRDFEGAITSFRKAIELKPDFFAAYHGLGRALLALRRHEEAIEAYQKALDLNPDSFEVLQNLGSTYHRAGRYAEAIAANQRALAIKPDHVETLVNQGASCYIAERHDEALLVLRRAIELDPANTSAMTNLGAVLRVKGDLEATITLFKTVVEAKPDNAEALSNFGAGLMEAQRLEEALPVLRRAVALAPNHAEALNNLGSALHRMGEVEEARVLIERALAIQPAYPDALNNLGLVHLKKNELKEAIAVLDRALGVAPEFAEANWNLALCQLLSGRFAEGLKNYEWRMRRREFGPVRKFDQPRWTLDTPPGGTVLIYAEQGLGDTLQFVRYVPRVMARGFTVVLEVQKLIQRMFDGIKGITTIAKGAPLPPFDHHIPLMSLPLAFGTRLENIPGRVPYLQVAEPDGAPWRARLREAAGGRLAVGLVWRGSKGHKNDRNRSFDPNLLAPLFGVPGVRLFSLQKEPREGDLEILQKLGPLVDLAPSLNDFADTAAAVSGLDLVVSVDTSVAHLAGALGKPVWIVLPFAPDWRWMLERTDSPWYPTARLFRQPTPMDWTTVLEDVARAVRGLAEDHQGAERV